MLTKSILPALVAFIGLTSAQVVTDCDPRKRTDCKPDPALGTSVNFNFNETADSELWETLVRGIDYSSDKGARFELKKGQSPTLRSKFYFFGGRTDIIMKASTGKGIISSMMWLSDDLDEVDWEFIGVNDTHASSNYFGKGDEDWTNAGWHAMDSIHSDYHNYSCVWTEDALKWYIDGNMVRELLPKDANDTKTYPQTPMRLSLGIWAGGDPDLPEGTRQWAGGDVDYDGGPYEMFVKSVYVEDGHTGVKEYKYTDKSGSWASIEAVKGNSTAYEYLNKEPEDDRSVGEKWEQDVSPGGKTAVYAGGAAVGAALLGGLLFYCIRQRRQGAKEAKLAAQRDADEQADLDKFRREGRDPDAFTSHGTEYNPATMGKDSVNVTEAYAMTSPSDEKAWGAAAAGAGAGAMAGGFAARGKQNDGSSSPLLPHPSSANPFDDSQRALSRDGHGQGAVDPFNQPPNRTASPANSHMSRAQSPMIRQGSPASPPAGPLPSLPNSYRGSPGPAASLRGSPGPEGMAGYRGSPGPENYRGLPAGPQPMSPSARSFSDNHQAGGYGSSRMQNKSPGPGMAYGQDRSVSQPQRGYGGSPGPQHY